MKTANIQIDNRDTPYTIDTYQTFTGDMAEELMIEDYNAENNAQLQYDDFEWEYNNAEILQALANASVESLNFNTNDRIITNYAYVPDSARSPRFYNYTTDHYKIDVTYNITLLASYIKTNQETYASYLQEYNMADDDYSKVIYYLETVIAKAYTQEQYLSDMYEKLTDIYYENITMTPR